MIKMLTETEEKIACYVNNMFTEDVGNTENVSVALNKCSVFSVSKKPIKKIHFCEICGRGFKEKDYLKQHYNVHTGARPYPCELCGKRFGDKSSRRNHYRIHTGEKPYSCEICSKSFTQSLHLREHAVTHTKVKSYTCEMCIKSFTTKSSLRRHFLTHEHKCDVCSITFKTHYKLERHRALHSLNRQFVCPVCDRRFVSQAAIREHSLCHSKEKKYICSICNVAYKRRHSLRSHFLRFHEEQVSRTCGVCNERFNPAITGTKHECFFEFEPPVVCNLCRKWFPSIDALAEHSTHHSTFDCKYCLKKYLCKTSVQNHMLSQHNEEYKDS